MEEFENNENQEYDINVVDFPFICRICLRRSDSPLFKVEDCLLNQYITITKINVRSTASLPAHMCDDCIKSLEDISLFIDISMYNKAKSGKNFMPINKNEHIETADYRTSQKYVIESEDTIEEYQEDLQYFKGFEICRICYSTNILKPVEEKAHLMQLFQNITNIDVEAEVVFSNAHCICKKCIKKLEIISLFISVSLCNEMKLKNTIGRNEAVETENCLEGNAIDKEYHIEVKDFDEFSYDSKILHTIIDIKEEIVDSFETSAEKMNQNRIQNFNESHSEENSFDCIPCKDEFSTETNLSRTNRCRYDSCDESFTQKHTLKSHLFNHTREKPLKCNFCKKTFNCKSSLQMHILIHSGEKPFKCESCEKSYSLKGTLQRHVLIHSEKRPFQCACCGKGFSQKGTLQTHMLIHTGERPFKCDCCGKSFLQKNGLQQHVLIHTGEKPFPCACCEKSFSEKWRLQRHMLIHTGKRPFKCGCCEKSFIQKGNLQKHMLIHGGEKPFKCCCCGKSFSLEGHLKSHLLTHSGEKPFKCDCCDKSFMRKYTFQQHMLFHSGEKPFKCGCCKQSFIEKWRLQRHMLIHTGRRPFKCSCCEKSFNRKSTLQMHMLIHTGEKPFKCERCEKSFIRKRQMAQHMLIHLGEKLFKCDCCDKSFIRERQLEQHMLIHLKEKPFKCDSCGKIFSRKGHLNRHMLIHSGEKPFKCDAIKVSVRKAVCKCICSFTLEKSRSNVIVKKVSLKRDGCNSIIQYIPNIQPTRGFMQEKNYLQNLLKLFRSRENYLIIFF